MPVTIDWVGLIFVCILLCAWIPWRYKISANLKTDSQFIFYFFWYFFTV